MTRTAATLLVVDLSNSFTEAWPRLARATGMRLESAPDVTSFGARAQNTIGIIAAGDDGGRLESAFRSLGTSPLAVAAVARRPDHRLAARVMRAGASEFFVLSQDFDALSAWLAAERDRLLSRRNGPIRGADGSAIAFPDIIGESPALRAALEQIARVIPQSRLTVLVTGEPGTGKGLVARAVHVNGPRRTEPWIEISCAAVPEPVLEAELFGHEPDAFDDAVTHKAGLFEIANGGTLFLDEIGQLPFRLQAKLLRVLEEGRVRRLGRSKPIPIDVRVIAATRVNLGAAVRRGQFREDLYHRLNVAPVTLPPLRDRPDDVVLLARHFLAAFADAYGVPGATLTPAAERALRARRWPGNVRELRNAIERAVLMSGGPIIDAASVQPDVDDAPMSNTPPRHLRAIIKNAVRDTLEQCGGNKSDAARRLGISRTRLQRLLA